MAILGIDFGGLHCVLVQIQQKTLVTIRNDLSELSTPSLVAFSSKERKLGEGAQTNINSNFKNTCRYVKQLMGVTESNKHEMELEQLFSLAPLTFTPKEEGGLAAYKVNYNGQECILSSTQCCAALLTRLKEVGEKNSDSGVDNVVISVPAWYNEAARQNILDAATIAGLTCLQTLNEHAAVAMDYGIFRIASFNDKKPSIVMFVNVGHCSSFVCLSEFTSSRLKILACEYDKRLGGRDFDKIILEYFAKKFETEKKINPLEYPKAKLKLETAALRARKTLSANMDCIVNIECLVQDYDFSTTFTREEFERLCQPYQNQLTSLISSLFQKNNIHPDSVPSVEIIGGCCRIPWVKTVIQNFFNGKITLSCTLNMDDSISRGCTLQAAILDPRYKVKDFKIIDLLFEPITLSYYTTRTDTQEPELKSGILFDKGTSLGSRKWLTFTRSADFSLQLSSTSEENVVSPLILHIKLPDVNLDSSFARKVKVGIKLTTSATLVCESAELLVDEIVEEPVTVPSNSDEIQSSSNPKDKTNTEQPAPMADDPPQEGEQTGSQNPESEAKTQESNSANVEAATVTKKKVRVHRYSCNVTSEPRLGFLNSSQIQAFKQFESQMISQDREQHQRREAINDLETYIYNTKNKLNDVLRPYATEQELQACFPLLDETHNWIYNTAIDTTPKEDYESRLHNLKKTCGPIAFRQEQLEDTKHEIQQLIQVIEHFKFETSEQKSSEWEHIPQDKMMSLIQKVQETDEWLHQTANIIQTTPLHATNKITPNMIQQEKESLINFARSILVAKSSVENNKQNNNNSTPDKKTEEEPSNDTNINTDSVEGNPLPSNDGIEN